MPSRPLRFPGGGHFLGCLVLLLAAACAPNYPLYTPLQAARSHGYAEEQLGPTSFLVSYTAPPSVTLAFTRAQRDKESAERVALAYDMALWRASELALQNGYSAFTISDRNNDVQVKVDYDYSYPYGPSYDPFLGRPPYGSWYPHPYPSLLDQRTIIDARVTLTIALMKEIRDGAFDARDAIAKLRARYPNALLAGQILD